MSDDVVDRAKAWIDDVAPMPLSVHFYAADEILKMVTGLVEEIDLLRSVQGLSVNIPEHGEWGSETLAYLFLDFGIQPGDGYEAAVARQGDLLRELAAAKAEVAAVAEESYRAGQRDAEVGQWDPEFGR